MYDIFVKLLNDRGISTATVCHDLGIPQSTMSNWKARRGFISVDLGKKIAKYFNVSMDYLYSGTEPDSIDPPETIVDRIKQLCKSRGISIAKLERDLCFANGSIVKTNSSTAIDRIYAIANYFNVSMEYIYTGEEIDPSAPEHDICENEHLRKLIKVAHDAAPEDLKLVTSLLKRLNREK